MASPSATKQARDSRGYPIDDALASYTAAGGTPFYAVVPPRPGARSVVRNFSYTCAATAHTLTLMVALSKARVQSDAASGQAVLNVSQLTAYPDGTQPAASDYLIAQYADGTWAGHLINSITGLAITVSANFAQQVPAFSNNNYEGIPLTGWVYFMGAVADHPDRQFVMVANTARDVYNPGSSWGTTLKNDEPILVHSANATNAGTLNWLAYGYVPVN